MMRSPFLYFDKLGQKEMSELTEALDRIHAWMQKEIPEYAESFQPELSSEKIDSIGKRLDLLKLFYRQRDAFCLLDEGVIHKILTTKTYNRNRKTALLKLRNKINHFKLSQYLWWRSYFA
jgi:cell wall assembly regulator SMI1